ncbi:Dolichyl-diphosphooligosaccharide-protein glycosyltransferase 48kDa subunit [Mytilinidion resinicola]|uniref:Dolichyl-diphosphooligosaccharide--protein glycosyltransferase subunit WBP1 n=1 Tax=Mytilinidion resinicola TaxID=574789 RepID=A0A6A6YH51_9PEZI|nr:Dolichyl-diphosphooligosaccharide-protein glycosyltransferase 48kDa subunit [Mytilinidion resinicola]KAF2807227.1 Dolichyl-diphosphooligosaccharide-protein glycosyltransferase 48kDa subunit [Mytilinidion resinicola]
MRWLFSFLVLALLGAVQALSSSGSRLLVVLEELAEKDKYSEFWDDLRGRGYTLSFESPKNDKLSIFKHGERAYDHLILFPPKTKGLGPALTPKLLLEFLKKDGNVLLTLSADHPTPSAIVSLLLELDIHLPSDRNTLVVDHFNYDTVSAGEKHDVLLVPAPKALRADVKNYFEVDGTIAVPRAVGQGLGNATPHLAPILRAGSSAYSYNPKDEAEIVEDPFAVGEQLSLVSAMQARNSARFTVVGSTEMLQNEWFDAKVGAVGGKEQTTTANRAFAAKVSEWTFKETGVLKVGRLQHYLNEGKKNVNESAVGVPEHNPGIYRIKTDVSFTIELSEYTSTHLSPFTPPATDDVQLEFSMLSPFHRLSLTPLAQTANSTIFGTSFVLPDQHGIFNFRVNYKRPFLTSVDEKRQVTVRHFAHDEWPRSWNISAAWVWVGGIWVTVAGWVAFVALWLYSEGVEKGVKKTQ